MLEIKAPLTTDHNLKMGEFYFYFPEFSIAHKHKHFDYSAAPPSATNPKLQDFSQLI